MPPALILAACAQQQPTVAPTITTQPTNIPSTAIPPTSVSTVQSATQAATTVPTIAAQLEPTPACGDTDDNPTPAQTEGPYFTPGSPERASLLESDMQGAKLVVTGIVQSTECQPIARALLDFWQCDDAGVYDNAGYTLRGHQFTDEQGRYRLETIVPGVYPGRTRHIHVKVQAPNNPVLTSQLYFPGEPRNRTDGIYNPALEMTLTENADGSKNGAFDFVLQV
ncbi:MAG: intradiol ring-cleavage dioxygenase [Chloroflexi bacterium]|nr:intradiol ring-cleavage dioxygenase [Chloroflexota bacterium]